MTRFIKQKIGYAIITKGPQTAGPFWNPADAKQTNIQRNAPKYGSI